MEIRLLDKKFVPVEVIDIYTSFIWTDRYYECGDFELKVPFTHIPKSMAVGMYITYDRSDRAMIIESMQTDRTEDENIVTISGRSLEILLDRRVIYEYIFFSGKLEDYVRLLLKNAVISPANAYRRIPGFSFKASGDADISAISAEAQHQGESLYTVICDICRKNHIGWRIRIVDKGLEFGIFKGKDRSASVIFSDGMNNISECQLIRSVTDYRNAALIIGSEDADAGKVYTDICSDDSRVISGIERRELSVNSSARYKTTDEYGNSVTLTDDQYISVLKSEGRDKLTEHRVTCTANGKTDSAYGQFEFRSDFFLGDIVTIDTGFSDETAARVTEATFSVGQDGFEEYQSFESTDDDSKGVDI